jgi:hypothetical protein
MILRVCCTSQSEVRSSYLIFGIRKDTGQQLVLSVLLHIALAKPLLSSGLLNLQEGAVAFSSLLHIAFDNYLLSCNLLEGT